MVGEVVDIPILFTCQRGKTFDSFMGSVGAELVHFVGMEWWGEVVDKHHRSLGWWGEVVNKHHRSTRH